ncbi:hypothetical protein DAPPUDRAFT_267226 [Daphnia pulex]|uniref:Uncharacterized protein n=1 Tax=Daphnia pulex TaxID=6669 RepID=E9HW72_DAPPU|nr:hypothetical protein DAPPUDRAFT_267226 [Daphnia pulex]|eukprot:EFX64009.1 hypothetical protein DAPPUDRAFT_267226 [Daphnia pulex]
MADGEPPHPHKLFVFLTQKLGTCYRTTQRKEGLKWIISMTIYGDPWRNQTYTDENEEAAYNMCIRAYITFLLEKEGL